MSIMRYNVSAPSLDVFFSLGAMVCVPVNAGNGRVYGGPYLFFKDYMLRPNKHFLCILDLYLSNNINLFHTFMSVFLLK